MAFSTKVKTVPSQAPFHTNDKWVKIKTGAFHPTVFISVFRICWCKFCEYNSDYIAPTRAQHFLSFVVFFNWSWL